MKKVLLLLLVIILASCSKESIETGITLKAESAGTFTVHLQYPGSDIIEDFTGAWSQTVQLTTGDTLQFTVVAWNEPAVMWMDNLYQEVYLFNSGTFNYIAP